MFLAFQELINCCAWQVPAAESLDGWSPEGLYQCRKYLKGNMDMVERFTEVLEEI